MRFYNVQDTTTVEAKATFKTQMTGFSRSMDGLVSNCAGSSVKTPVSAYPIASKHDGGCWNPAGNTNPSEMAGCRSVSDQQQQQQQKQSSIDEDPSEAEGESSLPHTPDSSSSSCSFSLTSSLPKYGMTALENARRRRKYSLRNRRRGKNSMAEEDVALVEEVLSKEESVLIK